MFKKYEVVLVFANTIEPYKKFYRKMSALQEAYSINKGRNHLGLHDVACTRQIGHFPYRRRSAV